MLTVARIDQNRIRVNVIPTRKREEDENAALCTPFSFSGTPEEVDGAMARNLWVDVEQNLRLQHTLEGAKAEMDAAAKIAREQASGKAGQTAKKTELQGGQQTRFDRDRGPGGSGKSPATSGLPTTRKRSPEQAACSEFLSAFYSLRFARTVDIR